MSNTAVASPLAAANPEAGTPDVDRDHRGHAYAKVAQAIAYLRAHAREQPDLAQVAQAVGLSPFHLQRLFCQWAGVSPKRFVQFLTKEHARAQLARQRDVLSVALDAGLSGPGRLHDLMVTCEAMTPGEIQAQGRGLTIGCGWGDTPFGPALLGWTARGVCHLAFDAPDVDPQADLHARWPGARIDRDDAHAQALLGQIFTATPTPGTLHLVLRGTNFQLQVWQALLRIPPGRVLSYRQLAQRAGCPRGARAVGSALAANGIGYLIPCHRVIRDDGDVGQYRWGAVRKLALLGWEAARSDPSATRQP